MNAEARDPVQALEPFSLEDVQRRRPLVRSIVADIVRLHRDLVERRERMPPVRRPSTPAASSGNVYEEELREIERGVLEDEQQLDGFIDELDSLGGILLDPADGRVEFPGLLDGRPIFWGLDLAAGESLYWRDAESSHSERRPCPAMTGPTSDSQLPTSNTSD